jgi:hypothetical protein
MDNGTDLVCGMRWHGRFAEAFELETFPFDAQALHVNMIFETRLDGKTPTRIQLDPDIVALVDPRNTFSLHQSWHLSNILGVVTGHADHDDNAKQGKRSVSTDRSFSTTTITALVARRPGFALAKVAVPAALISLLGFTPFALDIDLGGDRMNLSVILLLTIVAFLQSTTSFLPTINYLTLLDKYLFSSMLIIFGAIVASALSYLVSATRETDYVVVGALFVLWLLVKMYWFYGVSWAYRKRSEIVDRVERGTEAKPQKHVLDKERMLSRSATASRGLHTGTQKV